MPMIKNRLFQPVSVLLSDGKTLYLQSREAIEVSDADLESEHLKALLASEQVMLWDRRDGSAAPSREPPADAAVSETPEDPEPRGPRERMGSLGHR